MGFDTNKIINQLYYIERQLPLKESITKEELETLKTNKEIIEYSINNLSNNCFRNIVKKLGWPESAIATREKYEREIISNFKSLKSFESFKLLTIQEALCDLLFHNSKHNSKLDILTIKERATTVNEYNEKYKDYSELFDLTLEFLDSTEECGIDKIKEILCKMSEINKKINKDNKTIYEITQDLLNIAKNGFKNELTQKLTESKENMFKEIESEILETSDGKKIKMFKLQNQTPYQEQFYILTRGISTSFCNSLTEERALENYKTMIEETYNKRKYICYSLFDQSSHVSFLREGLIFGFFDINNSEILSCTAKDGQTNQWPFQEKSPTKRQNFSSLQNFMQTTGPTHNEIDFNNHDTILPNCIVSNSETPNDDIKRVASALNIPIIYIDDRCYKQYDKNNVIFETYSYDPRLKTPLDTALKELNPEKSL